MRWKHLFDSLILMRGQTYYRSGRVFRVVKKGNVYSGVVRGSENYAVTAKFLPTGALSSLGCSCPHAGKGNFCKHMAALLFAVEAGEYQEETDTMSAQSIWKDAVLPEEEIRKIAEEYEKDYHYFDFPAILKGLGIRRSVWEKGKALARSGSVVIDEFLFEPSAFVRSQKTPVPEGYVSGRIRIRDRSGMHRSLYGNEREEGFRLRATLSQSRAELLRCNCPGCATPYYAGSGAGEFCEHEAAFVYLIGRYILEKNPGDATSPSGERLLSGMGHILASPERVSELRQEITGVYVRRPLHMDASLIRRAGSRELEAVFRVGESRMYRIQSLEEFVQAAASGGSMRFGQSTVFVLGEDRFAEDSIPLWELLRDAVSGGRSLIGTGVKGVRGYTEVSGSSLPLFGDRLDRFYGLVRDKTLEYKEERCPKRLLTCRDMAPDLFFRVEVIEDGTGRFHGLELTGGLPDFQEGRKNIYWMDESHLNRADGEFAEATLPLRECAENGFVKIRIGRKHMESFLYDVLPYLRRYGEVSFAREEEILAMLPARESFRFYLDAAGGEATCRLCAVLGDEETEITPGSFEEEEDVYRADSGRETGRSLTADPDRETGGPSAPEFRERRKKAADLVREYFPEATADGMLFSTGNREDYVYLLLEEGVNRLLLAGDVQSTDAFRRIHIRRRPQVSVGVRLTGNLLELDVAGGDLSEEEMLEILSNYHRKKRFYRLKSGDFVNLRDNGIEELEALMEGLRMTPEEFVRGKMHLPAYRTLYLDRMLQNSEDLYTTRDVRFKAMIRAFRNVEDADYAIPEALTGVLRKYQKAGYRWLRTLASAGFGGILADEMGLGKTVQVIALLEAEREERERGGIPEKGASPEGNAVRSLIVAPASLVYNWSAEFARFAPKLKTLTVAGNQEERAALLENPGEAEVLITSYDLLKRDIDRYAGLSFRYEVIDEAQYIKNHTTAAAKAVKLIRSGVRFALTGTPIENRLSELWSIFDYLMPGFLYTYEDFRRSFENPIVKDEDEAVSARLGKMISPFLLRRFKKDVLKDLPEKLEEVRYSAMEADQRRLYDAQVLHMKQMLAMEEESDLGKNRMKILAELMRIRQICCDPSLCYADYSGPSAKREACRDLILSAIEGEHRVLVFSQFTSMLELLEQDMTAEGIEWYSITGETPKEERTGLVEKFNQGDVPVFFISLRAGGTGLNLTGADVVIHYDPWWNLAVQNQATDRAHRIGQQRNVTVYRLIMKGTVEERVLAMQEAKMKLAEDILGTGTAGSGAITKEELLELLSGDTYVQQAGG